MYNNYSERHVITIETWCQVYLCTWTGLTCQKRLVREKEIPAHEISMNFSGFSEIHGDASNKVVDI